MPGTKIINVLRDDTFKDILSIFRNTDAEDVVFVLPKRSAVFRREDHFAAFASEARRARRQISILCASDQVNDWARKYDFTVIAKKTAKATAAVAVLSDEDEEVRDPNTDAFDPDVPATSDESTGVTDEQSLDEAEGMHVEGEPEEPLADDQDEPSEEKELHADADESDDFDQVLKRYGSNDLELYDEDGNILAGAPQTGTATATLARQNSVSQNVGTLAATRSLDGVRSGGGSKLNVKARKERSVKVGVRARPDTEEEEDGLDYIDAVWRDTVGPDKEGLTEKKSSRWRSLFSRKEKVARRGRHLGNRRKTLVTTAIVAVVLASGAVLVLGFGKASIQIVPVSRNLEFQLNVQASDAFSSVDPLFNKIPGQLFEIEKIVEREFNATGSQEVAAKARGVIMVSNAFSTANQTLIATTRFEDSAGHIFRTLRTITVPGMRGDEPGTIEVEVIADKPGSDYNIAATSFTIPAFKEQGDSGRFEGFSGTTNAAFVGGALGLANVVTQEDIDNAISAVQEEIEREVEQAFDAQASDLLLINSAQAQIDGLELSVPVDTAVDTFTVFATGHLATVGFREEDLGALLIDHAFRNWQLVVLPAQLELHYAEIRFVEDRGILAFSVTALGDGYADVDKDEIIADIQGMGRDAVRDYFRAAEDVRSSTVILSPVWVRSIPDDPGSVEVELRYENSSGL